MMIIQDQLIKCADIFLRSLQIKIGWLIGFSPGFDNTGNWGNYRVINYLITNFSMNYSRFKTSKGGLGT